MMDFLKDKWENITRFLKTTRFWGSTLDNFLIKITYAIIIIFLIIWLLPTERPFEYSNLTVGSIAPEEIIAPFKFAIQKTPEELEREREAARASVPPLFDQVPDLGNVQQLTLNKFFSDIQGFFKTLQLQRNEDGQYVTPENIQAVVDSFLQQIAVHYRLVLPHDALIDLYTLYKDRKLNNFQHFFSRSLSVIYSRGVMDRLKTDIPENKIIVVNNGVEETFNLDEILEIPEAQSYILSTITKQYGEDTPQSRIAKHLISAFIRPNLLFNAKLTEERKERAVHEVPLTRGYVEQNERIVDSNEKITPEIYQKLYSLSLALKERSAEKGRWEQIKFQTGKLLFASMLLIFTVLYFYFYRRSIFQNNSYLGMITIIFVIQFLLTALIVKVLHWPPLSIPIILAPMLLAVLLDFGIAFICTVSLSLIMGAVLANDYTFTLMSLLVGSVAIFSVQKIRNRSDMVRSMLYILIAYFTVNLFTGLLHFSPLKSIMQDFAYYLILNSILTPVTVYFLVGIFERYFDVTTDITLLELSDLNHPLLKQLSVKAPGTFHHSIVVANLAEAAALSIGANALLIRVGCYFHDIGKMLKPEYFVENQMGGVNKHESLSPHMSSLILANHVKEGLKLAEKNRLPNAVKKFIPEHHGTSLMTFFYHKALGMADEKEINESDFRYPGPKPASKETAIAMLADTVEAASRTLQNPTPQRIRNLVDSLVNKKIEEGQLEDSNLTFQEIKKIKEAFVPILTGIHHVRIEYPSEADIEKEKKQHGEKTQSTKKEYTTPSKKRASDKSIESVKVQEKEGHGN
ncbi:MAG: HDIG domain-containing protein [Calditrichaeota bacterium]|nr:MAG: HDIG domain-containing protein [Calditrichota bacterium]